MRKRVKAAHVRMASLIPFRRVRHAFQRARIVGRELHYATIIAVPIQNSSFRRERRECTSAEAVAVDYYVECLQIFFIRKRTQSSNDTQTI